MTTRKFKIENYDRIEKKMDLLERYFWDHENGIGAAVIVEHQYAYERGENSIALSVFRTSAADGGYVVESQYIGQPPRIYGWEERLSTIKGLRSEGFGIQLKAAYEQAELRVSKLLAA
jgi:hypothetical protein